MARMSDKQIKNSCSRYLSKDESLLIIGIFKRIPSVSWLLLTRGMAWILSEKIYVGVTDRRMIILPESRVKSKQETAEDVIYAGFDEVAFNTDPLNNTILEIQKSYKNQPLKLRFKSGYQFMGLDQFDFIAAVKRGKQTGKVDETT